MGGRSDIIWRVRLCVVPTLLSSSSIFSSVVFWNLSILLLSSAFVNSITSLSITMSLSSLSKCSLVWLFNPSYKAKINAKVMWKNILWKIFTIVIVILQMSCSILSKCWLVWLFSPSYKAQVNTKVMDKIILWKIFTIAIFMLLMSSSSLSKCSVVCLVSPSYKAEVNWKFMF